MSLYTINTELNELLLSGVDENGVITDEALAMLEQLNLDREQKIENICCYIKNLRAEAVAIREEEKNLAERRKPMEAKADRLEAYLMQNLSEGEKFSTPRAFIKWTKGESVEVDESRVLKKYFRVKKEIDKAAIKADLKAGIKVRGASLIKTMGIKVK